MRDVCRQFFLQKRATTYFTLFASDYWFLMYSKPKRYIMKLMVLFDWIKRTDKIADFLTKRQKTQGKYVPFKIHEQITWLIVFRLVPIVGTIVLFSKASLRPYCKSLSLPFLLFLLYCISSRQKTRRKAHLQWKLDHRKLWIIARKWWWHYICIGRWKIGGQLHPGRKTYLTCPLVRAP